MKIMYLNPIETSIYDELFQKLLSKYKDQETELHVTSLQRKNSSIDNIEFSLSECFVSEQIINAVHKASREGFDAFVIGCFYDTCLVESREISGDMFVIGPCQSSISVALTIANNFSILVGNRISANKILNNLRLYGCQDRLISIEYTEQHVTDFQNKIDQTLTRLIAAGSIAVNDKYAECIILGCTLEANFCHELEKQLNVPIIDSAIIALKTAEKMAQLKLKYNLKPSRQWTSTMPSPDFLARNGIIDKNFQFGNTIVLKGKS